jgi:ankyrin repeat protein
MVDKMTVQVALFKACREGKLNDVRLLLSVEGIEIDTYDQYGYTALHIACWKGYNEIARLLLENGASVNVLSKYGSTSLHYASYHGHIELINMLLKKKPINSSKLNTIDDGHQLINTKNYSGYTAQQYAINHGNVEVIGIFNEYTNQLNADKISELEKQVAELQAKLEAINELVKC